MNDVVYWLVAVASLILVALATGLIVTARMEARVQRYAGRAVAARVALGRVIPVLDELLNGLEDVSFGASLEGRIDNALHVARAAVWGSGRYYRHVKRGTHYEVLSYKLHLQASEMKLLSDDVELVLYADTRTGRLSARHALEFHDGRFQRVSRTEALDADELAAQGNGRRAVVTDPDADLLGRMS